MVDRRLVLTREGAPICWGLFAGDLRRVIVACPADDMDLYQVWSVPSFEGSIIGEDITKRFAMEWAAEIKFVDGIEPSDYLASFPAFVREQCATELQARFAAEMAEFIPDPIRRSA